METCEGAVAMADGIQIDPLTESQLAAKRAELLVASGNVAAAARLAEARDLTAEDPASFVREGEQITLARILLAQGQTGAAQALLARLVAVAQTEGRVASLIKLFTLQALAYQMLRRTEQACHILTHALSLAEEEGFVRTFLDNGRPLVALLGQLAPTTYRDTLLDAFDVQAPGPKSPLIEPLSEREREVLHLIATGLSNQAIAEELILALGTVKAHTAAIYRKLDVNSRTQAVARARDLGLID
jgi:LuxR family maltose regulon positive regulatory protein